MVSRFSLSEFHMLHRNHIQRLAFGACRFIGRVKKRNLSGSQKFGRKQVEYLLKMVLRMYSVLKQGIQ